MKKIITFSIASIIVSFAFGKKEKDKRENTAMKQYYFVMLTKGKNRTQDSSTAEQIQKGHLENIGRLSEEGKLLVSGPFLDDGLWRGIFIFDLKDATEVEKVLQTDPAITSGRLAYEIHPWMTRKGTVFK
ncbi:MAG: hypothetical protein IPM95_03055 [Sphingobacteriales bacterium]|nr:hypothetical protein [Sphingobacteriales bacterium]